MMLYWCAGVAAAVLVAIFIFEEVRKFSLDHYAWRYERAESKWRFIASEGLGLVLAVLLHAGMGAILGGMAYMIVAALWQWLAE